MKLITIESDGTVDLVALEDYLDANREVLLGLVEGPSFLDSGRFGLHGGARSLHDARWTGFRAASGAKSGGTEPAEPSAELTLLGPYVDRTFHLRYEAVSCLSWVQPPADADLHVHELRLEGDGIVHEVQFLPSGWLSVACRRLSFHESMRSPNGSAGPSSDEVPRRTAADLAKEELDG